MPHGAHSPPCAFAVSVTRTTTNPLDQLRTNVERLIALVNPSDHDMHAYRNHAYRNNAELRVPAQARSCGACTFCCKVMMIEELQKPPGPWCEHRKGQNRLRDLWVAPAFLQSFLLPMAG